MAKAGRTRRRLVGIGVALAAAALFVWAWMPAAVEVDVATVSVGPLRVTVEAEGKTRVRDRFVLSSPVSGRTARIDLHPGDHVARGELVTVLSPAQAPLLDTRTRAEAEARLSSAKASRQRAAAAVERVRAALGLAEREQARQEQLVGEGATTPQAVDKARFEVRGQRAELASAKSGLEVAEGEVALAEAALRQLGSPEHGGVEVRSPIAGQVLKVVQESAAVVAAGAPLVELGDPSRLEVVLDVLTADAVTVAPGMPVVLENFGAERGLLGEVRRIEPAAFTKTSSLGVEEQRVNVIVDVISDDPVRARLGDAFHVDARIIRESEARAVKVPASGVFRYGEGHASFVVDDDRVRLRRVKPGKTDGRETQVLEGLAPGTRVVVYPSERVVDGVRIRIR